MAQCALKCTNKVEFLVTLASFFPISIRLSSSVIIMQPERATALHQLSLALETLRQDDPLVWSLNQCQTAVWQFIDCTCTTDLSPPMLRVRYDVESDRYFIYRLTFNVSLDCTVRRQATGSHLLQCAQGRVELNAQAKAHPPVVVPRRIDLQHYEAIGRQRLEQRELEGGAIVDTEKRALVLSLYVQHLKYATSDEDALQLSPSFRYKVAQVLGNDHTRRLFGATDEETAPRIRSTVVHIVEGQEFVNGLV